MTLSRPRRRRNTTRQRDRPGNSCARPAQEQRANLQGTPRERFRHPGEGLREMHHRPETDLKRSPG